MSKTRGKWLADNTVIETPSGTVNGVNVTFTLSNIPTNGSLDLKINGRQLYLTTDYTLSSATITMLVAPAFGLQLDAKYFKR